MPRSLLIGVTLGTLTCWLCLDAAVATGPSRGYTNMVIFGDSLSDTGNTRALTTIIPIASTRPVAPYYDPGRWTNGASQNGATLSYSRFLQPTLRATLAPTTLTGVWHEAIADRLGIPRASAVGAGSGPSAGQSLNFAVGGAVSGPGTSSITLGGSTFDLVRNLGHQVNQQFLAASPTITSDTLIVLSAGGNDLRDSVLAQSADSPTTRAAVRSAAAQAVSQQASLIQSIVNQAGGAQAPVNILWPSVVPIQAIPEFTRDTTSVGTARVSLAGIASAEFASVWSQQVASLRTANPGLNLVAIDFYSYFVSALNPANLPTGPLAGLNIAQPVVQYASGFGPSDVFFTPELNPLLGTAASTPPTLNPNAFAFWDPVHPSAFVHNLMGQFAFDNLPKAVPTPGTIAALAFAGVLATRRRRAA